MGSDLLIIFVKNQSLGQVKTRLANTIGNEAALEIYKELVAITEKATNSIEIDTHIYYSNFIDDSNWNQCEKFVQSGDDLGERMKNAFKNGFNAGYQNIVLIGSDLPSLTADIIRSGFDALKKSEVVFGPAEDGGYYLVGLNKFVLNIFMSKSWSTNHLLKDTLVELEKMNIEVATIETLNDIDTFDDLKKYPKLLNLISQNGKIY